MKIKKIITTIIIVLMIAFIVLFFIPIKSSEYIKYDNPFDDGGTVYKEYYNMFNIKIYENNK